MIDRSDPVQSEPAKIFSFIHAGQRNATQRNARQGKATKRSNATKRRERKSKTYHDVVLPSDPAGDVDAPKTPAGDAFLLMVKPGLLPLCLLFPLPPPPPLRAPKLIPTGKDCVRCVVLLFPVALAALNGGTWLTLLPKPDIVFFFFFFFFV